MKHKSTYLSIDQIMKNIQNASDKPRKQAQNRSNPPQDEEPLPKLTREMSWLRKAAKYVRKAGLGKLVDTIKANYNTHARNYVYTIEDFAAYYDTSFVNKAYERIMRRPPDPQGMAHCLDKLRSGRANKTEVLLQLYYSKEGRAKNVIILGIRKRAALYLLYRLPVLGKLFEAAGAVLLLPRTIRRLNAFENFAGYRVQSHEHDLVKNAQAIETVRDMAAKQYGSLRQEIETKAAQSALQHLRTQHEATAEKLEQKVAQYRHSLNDLKENVLHTARQVQAKQPPRATAPEPAVHAYDALYAAFEDRFRGSREDIMGRLEVYLPYLEKLPAKKEAFAFADVGCGRGEWLQLLQDRGYQGVYGIDLNEVMTVRTQQMGLDVVHEDALAHLRNLPEASLWGVSGFHIIEHLPFETAMELLTQTRRVLKKGGVMIFETPNPENIRVGACAFYTDMTHKNPIVPATLEFLADYAGFEQIEIKRLHPYGKYAASKDMFVRENFGAAMDFAVIGYK